jgi:carboxymethylenebutenolidase
MSWFSLLSLDGHQFKVLKKMPTTKPVGMVIVLQEIFGVNNHIETICKQLAAQGWLAVAPALFDRVQGEQALGYTATDIEMGRNKKEQITSAMSLLDIEAVFQWGRKQDYKTAVLGFCWGGTLAWLAASRLPLDAAVIYYGTQVAENLQANPSIPVLMHFGATDAHIPQSDVKKIAASFPAAVIYQYPAGHGFNCDERPAYHKPSAELSWIRTKEFLVNHIGVK